MPHYDDALTLREARAVYFDANRFGDNGGYDDAWVKFSVWVIPVAFPNTASRVRAVRFHDLHHVMTGYETTNQGESEIAAWELASGCADHHAAWVLNLAALPMGLLMSPRAVFQSFVRGRRSRNLYRREYTDALLSARVGDLRRELGLDQPVGDATLTDAIAFAACSIAGFATAAPLAVLMPVMGAGAALAARFVARAAT